MNSNTSYNFLIFLCLNRVYGDSFKKYKVIPNINKGINCIKKLIL